MSTNGMIALVALASISFLLFWLSRPATEEDVVRRKITAIDRRALRTFILLETGRRIALLSSAADRNLVIGKRITKVFRTSPRAPWQTIMLQNRHTLLVAHGSNLTETTWFSRWQKLTTVFHPDGHHHPRLHHR